MDILYSDHTHTHTHKNLKINNTLKVHPNFYLGTIIVNTNTQIDPPRMVAVLENKF